MKNLFKSVILSVVCSVALLNVAKAETIYQEKALIRVCEAVESNNPYSVRRAVENTGVSYKNLTEGLMCNGQTIIEFAISKQADESAAFLVKKARIRTEEVLAKL